VNLNFSLRSASNDVDVLVSLLRSPKWVTVQEPSDGIWLSPTGGTYVYEPWLLLPSREQLREELRFGVAHVLDKYAKNAAAAGFVRDNIYDLSRAGWQGACPLTRDSVVLDFGCGLGALSRSLARNCGTVVGIDGCYERLMINGAVNREMGVQNVHLICSDQTALAHVHDKCLDGIVLNGILEWLPEMATGEPRAVQCEFLRECRRVLKDDGWLYLGIENRWGFRYFLGRPDEHVDLMFSSLLPRWLADVYCRLARHKPYRTYTHIPKGYRRILAESGFGDISLYAVLPDYRGFESFRPLEVNRRAAGAARCLGISKAWKQWLVEFPSFFRRFVPALGIVALTSPKSSPPVWLRNLANPAADVEQVYVKWDQASFWYRTDNGQSRIRELALSAGAAAKLRHIDAIAQALRECQETTPFFEDWNLAEEEGYLWADRRALPGTTLSELRHGDHDASLPKVCELLRRTHAAGKSVRLPALGLSALFDNYAARGRDVLKSEVTDSLQRIIGYLEKRVSGETILMHGDCTPQNVLIAEDKPSLIDWEWCRLVTFPGYDVLKLLWYEGENPNGSLHFESAESFRKHLNDAKAKALFHLVHHEVDWQLAVLTYWVVRLARELGRFSVGGLRSSWITEVIEPSVKAAAQILAV